MIKDFDNWNELKKKLDIKSKPGYIHNGEVWMTSLGLNISTEANGTGDKFMRPVLIVSRPRYEQVLIVPLSTKQSLDYIKIDFIYKDQINYANILQCKVIDTARLQYRMGKTGETDLKIIKEKICELVNSQI
jgi:mRNA-degrading endonuclease toxin of MazEF toxin-antitoxin module